MKDIVVEVDRGCENCIIAREQPAGKRPAHVGERHQGLPRYWACNGVSPGALQVQPLHPGGIMLSISVIRSFVIFEAT